MQTLEREQARINAEVAEAEAQLANDGDKLASGQGIHSPCARPREGLRRELPEGQTRGPADVEPTFFQTIRVGDGASPTSRTRSLRLASRLTPGTSLGGSSRTMCEPPSDPRSAAYAAGLLREAGVDVSLTAGAQSEAQSPTQSSALPLAEPRPDAASRTCWPATQTDRRSSLPSHPSGRCKIVFASAIGIASRHLAGSSDT